MRPWKPCSRRRSLLRTRHFLIPISRHAIYTAVGLLQPSIRFMSHGVTGGPATSCSLEIWCPVYRHVAQQGWGYTLQYCGQDNSRAFTDSGSFNTLYERRSYWRRVQSTLHLMICIYGCADPAVLIIRMRLIFGFTIRQNTNSAFFHY